ncbi:MAG: hypothetical protein ACRDFW_08850, partial [bacterium]
TEAHVRLIRTDPSPSSVLFSPPRVVRLWFRLGSIEELDPRSSVVSVWDGRGRRVDHGKGGVDLNDLDRRSMIVRLRPVGPVRPRRATRRPRRLPPPRQTARQQHPARAAS